ILRWLQEARLHVNVAKSNFANDKIEYLGYILTREGIKPQHEKVWVVLALNPPKSVKELCTFLGLAQYYQDLWEKLSHLLAPLTDLVGKCGETKATHHNQTKKKPWFWTDKHQEVFEGIKHVIAREILLAYPDYNDVFEIETDASTHQIGAVITQRGRPLAFFSHKLSKPQTKYTVTERWNFLECLKEFKGMLWGQCIKVYMDHKNLVRDALGLSSHFGHQWRLLLEE
ncbi:LOW QUALITY PROTEIN: hypothetical protein ACHAW6_003176, partial [Cyclotella cf. meneghiniana]